MTFFGLIDASFLSYEHFTDAIPPCTANPLFSDCGTVLRSDYAKILGIPLAVVGVLYYGSLLTLIAIPGNRLKEFAVALSTGGFLSSLYFVYLQIFIIHAICIFCFASATISTLLFFLIQIKFYKQRKQCFIFVSMMFYKYIAKPIFFQINPEVVHNCMTRIGSLMGSSFITKLITSYMFQYKNSTLEQTVADIHFSNPIGLAAGFDYEARLTQILPCIGFGFQTVGTITNHPYSGNPKPILGRLPKSKSLMVNKGFKNLGARKTIKKLSNLQFNFPLGISIGRTNSKDIQTQQQAIQDIVESFIAFEKSKVGHTYYELNISCPNLFGNIEFYSEKNLDELLRAIDKLKLSRPLFIKMPIEKSNDETLTILKVISNHSPVGIILGNLQKDRSNPMLIQSEVAKFSVGNFSGKPTFNRSNELIKLAYQHFGDKLIIIGCGGVFSAKDAYEKITLGASLIQLITGMVFQGPQLISLINMELMELLKKDGFNHISEAVGSRNK